MAQLASDEDWKSKYCRLARAFAVYADKAETFMDWCMNELADVYGVEHFESLFVQETEQKASLRQSSTATGLVASPLRPEASDSYESMTSLDSVTPGKKQTFKLDLSGVGKSTWLSGSATQGEFYAELKREPSTGSRDNR